MFKVLIVDDMEVTRIQLKRLKLWGETSGFIIAWEASNGREALSILESNPVDLVITDIRMPIIDGIELLNIISEKKLCPCVVLLSDYTEFKYARQALVSGAFDYIRKPVDEEEFTKVLARGRLYLVDKKLEAEKLIELEKIAVEKTETFYPAGDVRQIIELIGRNGAWAVELANSMADTTREALGNDLIKTSLVLKNATAEVINSVAEGYPWIEKFIDIPELANIHSTKNYNLSSVKASLVHVVEELAATVSYFEYVKQDNDVVCRICRYVLDNVDGEISVKAVSEALFMNKNYLSQVFKDKTGITLKEYLTMVKMERAKKLIGEGSLKNYEIADKLGFRDIEYFSILFKKYTGQCPTKFRQANIMK